jgi:hypothetical protein
MWSRRSRVSVTMLVFGFAGAAQFSITAGSASVLSEDKIALLQRRASEIVTISQKICNIVSSAFRLGRGEVLMLGIPVAEPEQASGRKGLCVVFAVFVAKRRVASPAMLVQMIASLELAMAQVRHGSHTDPDTTADLYTKYLQAGDDDGYLDSVSRTAQDLSLIFTSILSARARWRSRFSSLVRRVSPDGVTINNSTSTPHYAVAAQAVGHRVPRKGQLCYYLPLATPLTLPLKNMVTGSHHFLDEGIIIGHPLVRDIGPHLAEP